VLDTFFRAAILRPFPKILWNTVFDFGIAQDSVGFSIFPVG
jgi:hypothetical protein